MLRKYLSVSIELCVLLISAVFIYLYELIRLLIPGKGKSLEGEVILVTGSANGLGNAICKELVQSRAKLVLWDVAEEENKRAAQELRNLGAEFVFEDTVDVSDRIQIVKAASRVRSQVGNVTILVNNAGICPMQQFLELTPEAIEKTFQVNCLAHFWTLKEFLPYMLEVNRGHIVTICSTMGQMATRGPLPYYATKHAVHGYIETLKDELNHRPSGCDIKFTTAYPFFIKTRMVCGDDCGLLLKFKFPSITPFLEVADVARRIVEGIKHEWEYLYIPEIFRIYLAGKFFLPSKLHRLAIDFFVDEDDFSVRLGSNNGSKSIINGHAKDLKDLENRSSTNFVTDFSALPPSTWISENARKDK